MSAANSEEREVTLPGIGTRVNLTSSLAGRVYTVYTDCALRDDGLFGVTLKSDTQSQDTPFTFTPCRILDAAADERGFVFIEGVGKRKEYTYKGVRKVRYFLAGGFGTWA